MKLKIRELKRSDFTVDKPASVVLSYYQMYFIDEHLQKQKPG